MSCVRIRGGASLKEGGALEGEETSLKSDNRSGHTRFSPLSPSPLPKAGLACACPRVGCWDFSIFCRFTSFGELCVAAEERGEDRHGACFLSIRQQVPGSRLEAAGGCALMVLLLVFLLFLSCSWKPALV